MAAQPAGELLRGSTYEIPHLRAGTAAVLSVPRRQMTSASVRAGKGTGGGQRGLALLEPSLSTLDRVLHMQEGALHVSIFPSFERIFIAMYLPVPSQHPTKGNSPDPDQPPRPSLPLGRGVPSSGLMALRAKNPFCLSVCLLILDH